MIPAILALKALLVSHNPALNRFATSTSGAFHLAALPLFRLSTTSYLIGSTSFYRNEAGVIVPPKVALQHIQTTVKDIESLMATGFQVSAVTLDEKPPSTYSPSSAQLINFDLIFADGHTAKGKMIKEHMDQRAVIEGTPHFMFTLDIQNADGEPLDSSRYSVSPSYSLSFVHTADFKMNPIINITTGSHKTHYLHQRLDEKSFKLNLNAA